MSEVDTRPAEDVVSYNPPLLDPGDAWKELPEAPLPLKLPLTDREREALARSPAFSGRVVWRNLVTDLLAAALVLFAVGVALEWVTRGRGKE